MKNYICDQFKELSSQLKILENSADKIEEIVKVCILAIKNGNKIIWCGNGGSATQSNHLVAEFVGRYRINRPAMNSISLTSNMANITAIANDYGYDFIFSRQLEAIGKKGDVLFGLSTSGNSKNVVLAFEQAKKMEITTIGLIGEKGGVMKDIADYPLCVPATTSAHIQEMHIVIGHLICDLIEQEFYGTK